MNSYFCIYKQSKDGKLLWCIKCNCQQKKQIIIQTGLVQIQVSMKPKQSSASITSYRNQYPPHQKETFDQIFDGVSDDLQGVTSSNLSQIVGSVNSNTCNSEKYTCNRKESIISDQTQKKKNQVRQKFNCYLENRHSIQKLEKENFNSFNLNSIKQYNSNTSGNVPTTRRNRTHETSNANQNEDQQFQQERGLINQLDAIQHQEKFNRQIEQFILLFNKKPENAINQYIKRGIIASQNPQSIAEYLIRMNALNKNTLGQYFGQNNAKAIKVMHEYCKLLNFKNMQFDKALRLMLGRFRLPGQAQQIERVIYQFTLVYYEDNQNTFTSVDQLFPFAYSIIMLATDAHNPKQQNKMTRQQFIKNTKGACPSIDPIYLSGIYDRITKQRFQTESNYIETLYVRLRDLSLPNLTQALKFTKQLIKGDIFIKFCKNTNKFVQRKLYLSSDEKQILWVTDPPGIIEQKPRYINIEDIADLSIGIGSEVMKKNKVPVEFDSMCFTITTLYRTLDLKARSNKDRAKWVNYIRAMLIQRRQQRRKKLQQQYDSKYNPEKIQEIWNTDIFPYWDKHWDYRHKKPKQKGYIARGIEALCCCWRSTRKNVEQLQDGKSFTHTSGFEIKSTLLQTLWKYGLPPGSRKTLWILIIGNNLALTPAILQDLRKKRKQTLALQKCPFDKEVIEMVETLLAMRIDLPPIRDLLLMSEVFYEVVAKNKTSNWGIALNGLANLIHSHHFLAFYRGQKTEIQLRISLFEHLLNKNVKSVKDHFEGLRLQARMYLVSWFLSVFSNCFSNQFLFRIWDNFLLEGQLYLFKVGISIIKYYQIELKMCTFGEGLKLLRFPKNTSSVLFFEILQNQIDVTSQDYESFIQKRKQAIIKTKVQSIPLQ